MDLKMEVKKISDSISLLSLTGEVDVYTAPQLKKQINSLITEGAKNVIVNLEAVEYLDSTALGVLIGRLKKLREVDGSLDIVCGNGRVKRIFEITGLDKVLTIWPSEDAILEKINSKESV